MVTDTQITEIRGRSWLVNELLSAGLEVAAPLRDHGIDLIAYRDLDMSKEPSHDARFVARPIQLKAATAERFLIDRKFAKLLDLLLVYVWHLDDPAQTAAYALSYQQALDIADQMGYTATVSWNRDGLYNTSAPSKRLVEKLEPHRTTRERWHQLIGGAPTSTGSVMRG